MRIGDNMSKLTGDYGLKTRNDNTNYLFVNNFCYGVFLNYGLKKNFSIQPELNLKTKGLKYRQSEGLIGASWNGKAEFRYLDIPILVNYSYGKKLAGFVNIGPSINILLSGGVYDYYRWGSQEGGISYNYSRNIKSDFNSVSIEIVNGIGLKYNIFSKVKLFTEFRICYDLSNAAKKIEYIDQNTYETWYYDSSRFLDLALYFGVSYKF